MTIFFRKKVVTLPQPSDYQTARKYWNKLKQRLKKEGSQSVTNRYRLKLTAANGENIFEKTYP